MPPENEDLEKDYDDAFDEASGENNGASDEEQDFAADDETAEGDETPPAAEAGDGEGDDSEEEESPGESASADDDTGGDGAEKPTDEAAGEAGDEGPAAEEEPPAAPKYDEETIKRAAELLRKTQAPAKDEQPAADDEPEPEPEKTWLDYVPEDKRSVVEKYEQEWAEVSEGEQIKRTAELQLLQDRLYSDLKSALAPVFETTQKLQVNAHFDAIRQQHSDFDEIRDELAAWIDEQPEFVRPAYQEVASKGSPQQVVAMIDQFKAAKGMTGAVPAVPASSARKPEQRKPAQKQPAAGAKKALAAAPSPSKAEVPGSARHDDFDDAFEEAAGGI